MVRIYARNELIKTHERKPPGGRSTDYTDYPDGRAPYALRWPNYYCKRARDLGTAVGDFTDKLLSGEFPWSRLRQAQKLLGLAERYGAARLDAACRRALDFDLLETSTACSAFWNRDWNRKRNHSPSSDSSRCWS